MFFFSNYVCNVFFKLLDGPGIIDIHPVLQVSLKKKNVLLNRANVNENI
jgi:hypothetical protein